MRAEGAGKRTLMNRALNSVFNWIKGHPWWAATTGAFGASILAALTEAVVSGAQSHALAIARVIAFGWHSFPVAGWIAIGPFCFLGALYVLEKFRGLQELPDESQGVRWRCVWEGGKIDKMYPVCPNPNCRNDLKIMQAGGQYGSDAVFVCESAGCGFRLRHEVIPAVVLADAQRDLEGQVRDKPPLPPRERESRIWFA